MRPLSSRFLKLAMSAGLLAWMLPGCATHHSHKSNSYDRAISDEDKDPTYKADPERADEEVREAQ
jgi:hypothetical protein